MASRSFVAGMALFALLLGACSDDPAGPVAVASVRVNAPANAVIGVGGSLTLSAAVLGANGASLADRTIRWSSADTTIATVSATGAVSGITLGTTWIRASVENHTDSLEIRVDRTAGGDGWVFVTSGYRHSCALRANGDAYCWGTGYLGNGPTTSTVSNVPVRVALPGGARFAVIRGGGFYMSCGLSTTGDAYCWGNARAGGLGNSSAVESALPVRVEIPAGLTLRDIQVAFTHACALTTAGSVYCWGSGTGGTLGTGTAAHSAIPVMVTAPAGVRFTALSTASQSTCALTEARDVYCWGIDYFGEMGTGLAGNQLSPVKVALPAGTSVSQLAGGTGGFHHCALIADGSMYCWGQNPNGQFGSGSTAREVRTPVRVTAPGGERITSIARGFDFTCVTTAAGRVLCAGLNDDGQLGRGNLENSATLGPISIGAEHRFDLVASGFWHACGLTVRGEIHCWGAGNVGQMGNGRNDETTPVPVRVSLPTS